MNGDPCDQTRGPEASGIVARLHTGLRRLRGFVKDRAANVYIMFAIVFPLLLILIGAGMDYSYAENSKRMLQDATDAAALAVTAAVVKNPNLDVASLKTIAQNAINANFTGNGGTAPVISDFHVCAPVQNDCSSPTNGTLTNNTVLVQASGTAPCTLGSLLPYVCNASGGQASNLGAKTVTVIGFGATMELNLVMDTSASMIVGATDADVTKIANWMGYSTSTQHCTGSGKNKTCTQVVSYPNWNAMKPDDPGPAFSGDNPPCAFACHDVSGATSTDIQTGLTNAHTAGATTRYDVMTTAASALIDHVNSVTQNSTILSKNTYEFNIWSLNTSLTQLGAADTDFTGAKAAIAAMTPGLDTYLNSAMGTLATNMGKNGNGTAAKPLKFLILVTDGLQSDRSKNWNSPTFAAPISASNCTTMKNNGIVLAVLETPYVPLDGQSPNVKPYENTVKKVIYPNNTEPSPWTSSPAPPSNASVVSNALYNCATTGYYFRATNSSDIQTGFIQLTDKFLSQSSYIAH